MLGWSIIRQCSAAMNYLAHLHLADISQSSPLGNLLGDFVKGRDLSAYSDNLVTGIRLHRAIDQYTDLHPANTAARNLFPTEYRRYAGICLDVFWDYFLSNQWPRFHPQPLAPWVEQQYQALSTDLERLKQENLRLTEVLPRMIKYDWLTSYGETNNIGLALQRIGMRLRRPMPLDDTLKVLTGHQNELENLFLSFYPDVMDFARETNIKLEERAPSD